MTTRLTLTFRHVIRCGVIESLARDFGTRLERQEAGISRCDFTFLRLADTAIRPGQFAVRIHLSLPTAQIHADSVLRNGEGHTEVIGALREAYGNASRQLDDRLKERCARFSL
jgi:hypothetical protein